MVDEIARMEGIRQRAALAAEVGTIPSPFEGSEGASLICPTPWPLNTDGDGLFREVRCVVRPSTADALGLRYVDVLDERREKGWSSLAHLASEALRWKQELHELLTMFRMGQVLVAGEVLAQAHLSWSEQSAALQTLSRIDRHEQRGRGDIRRVPTAQSGHELLERAIERAWQIAMDATHRLDAANDRVLTRFRSGQLLDALVGRCLREPLDIPDLAGWFAGLLGELGGSSERAQGLLTRELVENGTEDLDDLRDWMASRAVAKSSAREFVYELALSHPHLGYFDETLSTWLSEEGPAFHERYLKLLEREPYNVDIGDLEPLYPSVRLTALGHWMENYGGEDRWIDAMKQLFDDAVALPDEELAFSVLDAYNMWRMEAVEGQSRTVSRGETYEVFDASALAMLAKNPERLGNYLDETKWDDDFWENWFPDPDSRHPDDERSVWLVELDEAARKRVLLAARAGKDAATIRHLTPTPPRQTSAKERKQWLAQMIGGEGPPNFNDDVLAEIRDLFPVSSGDDLVLRVEWVRERVSDEWHEGIWTLLQERWIGELPAPVPAEDQRRSLLLAFSGDTDFTRSWWDSLEHELMEAGK